MKLAASLTLAAAACAFAAPASAQFAKPEDAVKYRQGALFVMGQHFGRLGAMANGRIPYDPQAAIQNAEAVAYLARLPWAGFTENTDMLSPKAKSDIWKNQAKFREHSDKLVAESTRLVAAARTNDLDNLKAAFRSTAGSCKACHDSFRD